MSIPLLQAEGLMKRIQAAPRVSLFLDFDGTLSWIAPVPEEAVLEDHTRDTLQRIGCHPRFVTTVISGRSIEDLYSRIRLDRLIYAGNHGLEIFGRHVRFVEPGAAAQRELLGRVADDLALKIAAIPGAFVEYKGYSASVHYRQVGLADLPALEALVRSAVDSSPAQFRLNAGKKVFDICPHTGWHKGKAVLWINRHLADDGRCLSIYIGDDSTDEDAFEELPDGITVKVGAAAGTCAQYQLPDPSAVRAFLEELAANVL
jgi:trehalose 6-phosphate phosphatase